MYQIAGTIGIARRNGFDFAFPYWKNYDHAERFGSQEDIDVQKHFVNPLPVYNGPVLPDYCVQWGYHDVRLKQSVSISGHLQSLKYFEHCLDEVRYYFRMKDELEIQDLCAVHVRLGDYDNAYHPRLGLEYYIPAMMGFPVTTTFLLFSDDQESARIMFDRIDEQTDRRYNFLYSAEDTYLDDFRIMKSCRHFIIGNSSYSAMAATLGEAKDKIVVAPDPWFGKKYTGITGKDIYNPGWGIVNWENQKQFA
jgi:hypothetical protein